MGLEESKNEHWGDVANLMFKHANRDRGIEKLNGYWEEGYHFYIEIRDPEITIRDYRRAVMLKTTISFDAEALNAGKKTPIKLEDNVLSVGGANNPMSWFEEFYYEDGLLKAVEGYSFMDRKDPYTMKKVDHGPFDHIVIRDDEYLEKLQGVWVQWSPVKREHPDVLLIKGNHFTWRLYSGDFHVISYNKQGYETDRLYMVPVDLTQSEFSGCTSFEIFPDMITGNEMVFDMSMPMAVFAREEDIDKIEVPPAAKQPARSVMGPAAMFDMMPSAPPQNTIFDMPMLTDPPAPGDTSAGVLFDKTMKEQQKPAGPEPVFIPVEKEGDDPYRLKEPYTCPCCGTVFEDSLRKFCWNCGSILRK